MSANVRRVDVNDNANEADFFTAPWGDFKPSATQAALIALTRNTPLQRGRMRHRMTNVITGMGRPLDITFRDLKFRIEGRNNLIEYGLLTRKHYNGPEIDFLTEGLSPGDVALDIGCNIGLYSMPMARAVGAEGRVLAIDANPAMISHLRFHAKANGYDQVTAVSTAVGGSEAKVDLLIRRDDVAIVKVEENPEGAIQMRPLAQIVSEAGVDRVDALKIDIEGHEDQALVPYFEEVPEALWPSRIVIEYGGADDYPGCVRVLGERDYKLMGRTRSNSMYLRA